MNHCMCEVMMRDLVTNFGEVEPSTSLMSHDPLQKQKSSAMAVAAG